MPQQVGLSGGGFDQLALAGGKTGVVRGQPAVLGGVGVKELVQAIYRDQLIGVVVVDLRPACVDQGGDRCLLVIDLTGGVDQRQQRPAGRGAVPGVGGVGHGVADDLQLAAVHGVVEISTGIPNGNAHAVAHAQGGLVAVVGAKVIAEGPAQLGIVFKVIGHRRDAVPRPDLQRVRQVPRELEIHGQQQGHPIPRRVGQGSHDSVVRQAVQRLHIGVCHVIGHLTVRVATAIIGDVRQLLRGGGRSRCRRDGQQARQQCQRQRQGDEAFPQQCFHTNPLLSSITYHHYPGNDIRCQDRFDIFPAMYTNPLPSTG